MKIIFGLAIIASFFSTPAFAGEAFVFNQWRMQQSRTDVNYNIDSTTYSNRNEDYSSSSNKLYIDGKVTTSNNNAQTVESFKDFTIHHAGSSVNGSFREETRNRIWGTINTIINSYSYTHESSAGIR